MKTAFYTLGCKLNFAETTAIGRQFKKEGFEVVNFDSVADVYVINTCTVTDTANKECRQVIRRAQRRNPYSYIIVTGCYAQLKPEEIAGIEGVDLVLGSNEKFDLFNYTGDFRKKESPSIFVTSTDKIDSFGVIFPDESESGKKKEGRTRAFFKIQDGCDYKCAYCTIPLARGRSRSLNPEELLRQFNNLLRLDYKEIILTGVNIGDYGKQFRTSFYDLLKMLSGQVGDYRIRISSIEPNLLTDEIIELCKSNVKICNHFHIPLQSGTDKILKLMQRRYLSGEYEKLIQKLVKEIPDVSIGVDVITGFPGETYDDFINTYNFIKDLPVSYLHTFTYSEREDTKALLMPGIVDPSERKKRNNMLRILSEKKKNQFYSVMAGKTVRVLFEQGEGSSKRGKGKEYIKGFSSNYIRVKYRHEEGLENSFARVKLESLDSGEYLVTRNEKLK
ncbi:MAG: tRNA (N(6)-L-threonylcarbamoyladenosine(37)-C(2))-methylthiotransferase MtaB [Ignavibacteriaceae bacterium]